MPKTDPPLTEKSWATNEQSYEMKRGTFSEVSMNYTAACGGVITQGNKWFLKPLYSCHGLEKSDASTFPKTTSVMFLKCVICVIVITP
jgi:hypothetical protein